MKIKDFKKLSITDGDVLVLSSKEFDTDPKRQKVCRLLGTILFKKRVGILFLDNVNDDIAIKKHMINYLDAERKKIEEANGKVEEQISFEV